jgi:excisionase family DNA binding protein
VRDDRRLTLTVERAGAVLGISRTWAHDVVGRGHLLFLRLGRRVLISRQALDQDG